MALTPPPQHHNDTKNSLQVSPNHSPSPREGWNYCIRTVPIMKETMRTPGGSHQAYVHTHVVKLLHLDCSRKELSAKQWNALYSKVCLTVKLFTLTINCRLDSALFRVSHMRSTLEAAQHTHTTHRCSLQSSCGPGYSVTELKPELTVRTQKQCITMLCSL